MATWAFGTEGLRPAVSAGALVVLLALLAWFGADAAFRLLAQELGVLLSDSVLDQRDHDRDHQCPDRQVVCGGRLRRGE